MSAALRFMARSSGYAVRLTVETIDEPAGDRAAAIARLKAGTASMHFFPEGPLPGRVRTPPLQMASTYWVTSSSSAQFFSREGTALP
jgi:hypothetical protein